jgi:hypothetical protein
MKLVYQNWSKENVNDETIKNDLRLLSKGALEIGSDQDLNSLSRANKAKKWDNDTRKSSSGKFRHGGGHGGERHGGGGHSNNNRNNRFKKKR